MRKRYIVVPAAILLIAATAYSVYWLILAGRLRDGLAPWAAARRAEGYDVAWDSVAVGGFPLAFRFTFAGASFVREASTPFAAKAPLLTLSAAPWNLRTWHAETPQGARMSTMGAAVDAIGVSGAATIERGADSTLDIDAIEPAGSGLAAGLRAGELTLHLTLPAKAPADHREPAIDAVIDIAHLTLPATVPPLGATIDHLSAAAIVKGRVPPGAPAQSLAAWRDDGGTLELTRGSLHWGSLSLETKGTLALDGQLQPIGSLSATIEGQNEIIDAAVSAGTLKSRDAGLAKMVLSIIAKPGPDGRPQLKAPIRLQEGHLSLGPAKIAALPHIEWRQ